MTNEAKFEKQADSQFPSVTIDLAPVAMPSRLRVTTEKGFVMSDDLEEARTIRFLAKEVFAVWGVRNRHIAEARRLFRALTTIDGLNKVIVRGIVIEKI